MFSTRILYEPGFVFEGSSLEVVENMPVKKKRARVKCRCLYKGCGKEKEYNVCDIKSGRTKTCGCSVIERLRENHPTRGKLKKNRNTPERRLHSVWHFIKRRCYNTKERFYKDYGGRGITLCDEWLNDFQAFYDYCMACGWQPGLQIDRINNDGNYEPGNIRFVTNKENNRNRRDNIVLTIDGITCCLKEHAERAGLTYNTVYSRYTAMGWDVKDLLRPPKEKKALDPVFKSS
ncbi:hypothetical protein LJC59_00865 [Desulfovibrio sp. OttesenSCG-928-A18]|nr:hypothetical protein [Desulfovibrio sp. OttesenSCG-928-A18]